MGTRNSLAPSGEDLKRTGVSTSVKSALEVRTEINHDGQGHASLVENIAHYLRDPAACSQISRQGRAAQVEIAETGSQILIRL